MKRARNCAVRTTQLDGDRVPEQARPPCRRLSHPRVFGRIFRVVVRQHGRCAIPDWLLFEPIPSSKRSTACGLPFYPLILLLMFSPLTSRARADAPVGATLITFLYCKNFLKWPSLRGRSVQGEMLQTTDRPFGLGLHTSECRMATAFGEIREWIDSIS